MKPPNQGIRRFIEKVNIRRQILPFLSANSVLRASLAPYHLISNAHWWNNDVRLLVHFFDVDSRGVHLGIFGWVCAARDSKLAPRSKKNSP